MNTTEIIQRADDLAEAANKAKNLADHLAGQLRGNRNTVQAADEQLHQLHAINEALLKKVADLEWQVETHTAAHTGYKKALEDTNLALYRAQNEASRLRSENADLTTRLEASQKWERYHGEARDKAVNELRKTQIALENARDSLAIERKHVDNDFRQMVELKKELERTHGELATVREQSKIAHNAGVSLTAELAEAKAEIERLKVENNRLTHATIDAQTTATNLMISREAAETSAKNLLATQDAILKKLEETEQKAINAAQQAFDNGRRANHYKDQRDRLRQDMSGLLGFAVSYTGTLPYRLSAKVSQVASQSLADTKGEA